jgi:hypothetical protein
VRVSRLNGCGRRAGAGGLVQYGNQYCRGGACWSSSAMTELNPDDALTKGLDQSLGEVC